MRGGAKSGRGAVGQLDVIGKAKGGEAADQPEAGVGLARFKAEAGGMEEGVMVAVKRLAKGNQAKAGQVIALHGQARDTPALVATFMREVDHSPMPGQ